MKVHLFSAASSPGCANYGFKEIAHTFAEECGEDAAQFLCTGFYVDDGLTSTETVQDAKRLINQTSLLCSKGNLKLHKFASNAEEVMDSLPVNERAQPFNFPEPVPTERVLGIQWCVQSDTLKFHISVSHKPLTRRGLLSTVGSIYDPLGLIGQRVGRQSYSAGDVPR